MSHLLKGEYILGWKGICWEGRTYKFVEKEVYSGKERYILRVSHIVVNYVKRSEGTR